MRHSADTIDLDAALARTPWVQRPHPLARIWHWRHVPLLGGMVPAGLIDLGVTTSPAAPLSIVAGALVSVAVTPELRRWLVARYRCLVVPHALRHTFEDGSICSLDGRTPAVVWTSTLPRGVRVRLRCPVGMRTRDVEKAADLLQAACGADEVVVVRDNGSRTVIVGLRFAPRDRWWER